MFNRLFGWMAGIGAFLSRFVKTEAARMLEDFGHLAEDVVRKVETQHKDRPGAEKFELAKAMLIEKLEARKLVYTISAVNTAIEMAVDLIGVEP